MWFFNLNYIDFCATTGFFLPFFLSVCPLITLTLFCHCFFRNHLRESEAISTVAVRRADNVSRLAMSPGTFNDETTCVSVLDMAKQNLKKELKLKVAHYFIRAFHPVLISFQFRFFFIPSTTHYFSDYVVSVVHLSRHFEYTWWYPFCRQVPKVSHLTSPRVLNYWSWRFDIHFIWMEICMFLFNLQLKIS